jgi:hypothetical protein
MIEKKVKEKEKRGLFTGMEFEFDGLKRPIGE